MRSCIFRHQRFIINSSKKEISKNALHFQMKSDMLETSLSTLRKPETAETEMSTTVMSTHTTGNYY